MSISCIIPTHGRHEFLEESVRSALLQSYRPLEILVVSDCEDPASREVCRRLAAEGAVPVVYVENLVNGGGASMSRNHGASRAAGDFLAFLDDDDRWEPDYLEAVASTLTRLEVDVVVTWIMEFGEGGERSGPMIKPGLRAQDVAAINPGATGSNIVVSAKAFAVVGGFDEDLRVKNDTDFFHCLLKSGAKYGVCRSHSVWQRKHLSGQLTARTEVRALGTEMYLQKHLPSLTATDLRLLRQQIHRIRAYSSSSLSGKLWHFALVLRLHRAEDLLLKLLRGRDRKYVRVVPFREHR